jgi:glucosyl-3-phosphoglycerate phosphatase
MSLTRLVLLRHGRTVWNAEHRMQGRLDPDLDDHGREQALLAAPAVAAYEPAVLVASDQVRAWQTAEAVGKAAGLVPRADPRLRETSVGEWEGLTGSEVDAGWPGGLTSWRTDPTWAPPSGESRVDVAERARPVVVDLEAELADSAERTTAVLVAHGGTIIALTAATLGWPVSSWPSLSPLDNCHWTVLEHRIDRWRLVAWGRGATA